MLETPFGSALTAYHRGDQSSSFVIERSDGHCETVPASIFFEDRQFTNLESIALASCYGHVLDVGACAGRHSLALRRSGLKTTSLEIEESCREIMEAKDLDNIIIGDINNLKDCKFDTILMLANGAGIFGTEDSLKAFLLRLPSLLETGGKMLCDSTDISASDSPDLAAYRLRNIKNGEPQGKVVYRISRGELLGPDFSWLYFSFAELSSYCMEAGLNCSILHQGENGQFLAEVSPVM